MKILLVTDHYLPGYRAGGPLRTIAGLIERFADEHEFFVLTRDRDFGALTFVAKARSGVIYLRMLPENQDLVHAEMMSVLNQYSENQLLASFVVVEPGRHRIRQTPRQTMNVRQRPVFQLVKHQL